MNQCHACQHWKLWQSIITDFEIQLQNISTMGSSGIAPTISVTRHDVGHCMMTSEGDFEPKFRIARGLTAADWGCDQWKGW